MNPIQVRPAGAADQAATVDVVVLAFGADPLARWCWPDPTVFLRHFPRFVRAFAGRAFERGTAYCAEGHAGAALWLAPGVAPDEQPLLELLDGTTPPERRGDLFGLLEAMGRHHPAEPHWYLPLIGVDPLRQGAGVGSALMRHALAVCDRDGLPAYLESTNPRNVPLYERHGFERIATIGCGGTPPMLCMLRRAR